MSINWNFGDQRAIETKSTFTKDADAAFDEFCKTYLNSSNGFFMSTPVSSNSKSFSSDSHFDNIDSFVNKLSGTKSLNNTNNRPYIIEKYEFVDQNKISKSAKNTVSFRDSLSYLNGTDIYKRPNEIVVQLEPRKSHEKKLDEIQDVLTKINLDSPNNIATNNISASKESPKSNLTKNPEDILINLRLKNPKNKPKRRSIENLMETFHEFNKANKINQLPTQIDEESLNISRAPSVNQLSLKSLKNEVNLMSVEKNQHRYAADKDLMSKSIRIKTTDSFKQDDQSRPKSFYGYPNNFYIEKYLESSYKTIDIIDHLNEFNKNYEQMNKLNGSKSACESDFSAINKYTELTLNDEKQRKSSHSEEEKTKTLNIDDTMLLAQLNNMNQLQHESKSLSKKSMNGETNFIVNINSNSNIDKQKATEDPVNYRNLLENEAKRENISIQNFLNDNSFLVNNQLESEKDYNRISYLESLATQEPSQINENSSLFSLSNSCSAFNQDNRYQKPSCMLNANYDTLIMDIPKKKAFSDEFFKPKTNLNHQIDQSIEIITSNCQFNPISSCSISGSRPSNEKETKNNRENDSIVNDHTSSYIAIPPTLKFEKPLGWLGFKVIACGMKKNGKLPIPKPNYFIEKGDFGDDAGFYSENVYGDAIGIADGATGNCMLGYDPGDFSRNLMQLCSEIFVRENQMYDAKNLLLKAYDAVQDKTCYGSCTACVLTLSHNESLMTAANVGDTGYCVIRNNKIIYKSTPQRISYECPKQLDSYPWKEKSRKMGVSYTEILGNDTVCETFKVQKDDIIIVSSDGLYDNLEFDEIEDIYQKSKNDYDAVRNLVFNSVKFYRKPDDILVIIAKVVDNKPACIQQKFTKDPYTPATSNLY